MRRPRRNHSPQFKARLALAVLHSDKSLTELAEQFDVLPNQVTAIAPSSARPLLTRGALSAFPDGRGTTLSSMTCLKNHYLYNEILMEYTRTRSFDTEGLRSSTR